MAARSPRRFPRPSDQPTIPLGPLDELHAQIVTLKMVKSAGPLMQSLEKKLQEMSDKVSKATIDVVSLQEKLMVTRIKFQDGVADLTLEKKAEATAVAGKI
jgi:hypothetical protein